MLQVEPDVDLLSSMESKKGLLPSQARAVMSPEQPVISRTAVNSEQKISDAFQDCVKFIDSSFKDKVN
jgi:hypothetical protein